VLALDTPSTLQAAFDGVLLEVRTGQPRRARQAAAEVDGVAGIQAFGDRLHVTATSLEPTRGELAHALAVAGEESAEIEEIAPSLEDVFLALVTAARATDDGEPQEATPS
jgi:ABC-2 type transport system ATP-binding protein